MDILSGVIVSLISAFVGSVFTLFLTNRKEKREAKNRFRNRLTILAFELKGNFRNSGTWHLPFKTLALEKIVHDEPMIHTDPELFKMASHCLGVSYALLTAQPYHRILRPAHGQDLMKQLAEYIHKKYNIEGVEFIPHNLRGR